MSDGKTPFNILFLRAADSAPSITAKVQLRLDAIGRMKHARVPA